MKQLKKQLLTVSCMGLMMIFSVSCEKNGDDERVLSFDEAGTFMLDTFQIKRLNEVIGMPQKDFLKLFPSEKAYTTDYDEDEGKDEVSYEATAFDAPFKRVKVTASFTENIFRFDQLVKGKNFRGVHDIAFSVEEPVSDYKLVLTYFHRLVNQVQKTDTAQLYYGRNEEMNYDTRNLKGADYIRSFDQLIKELGNSNKQMDGVMSWSFNAYPTLANSSVDKNKPVWTVTYDFAKHAYRCYIEWAAPKDLYRLFF